MYSSPWSDPISTPVAKPPGKRHRWKRRKYFRRGAAKTVPNNDIPRDHTIIQQQRIASAFFSNSKAGMMLSMLATMWVPAMEEAIV